jgi:hypothetical protein
MEADMVWSEAHSRPASVQSLKAYQQGFDDLSD